VFVLENAPIRKIGCMAWELFAADVIGEILVLVQI
jgi:hypothetical protein